ncbi:MAG: hypothetical protein AB7O66_10970 [Limisphaerales bacterium]
MTYIHDAVDYDTPVDGPTAPGCAPCGSSAGAASDGAVNSLPHLRLVRYHRPGNAGYISSFGSSVYLNFDINLIHRPSTGEISYLTLFDPATQQPIRYDKQSDNTFKDLQLAGGTVRVYDATGALTTAADLAAWAVVSLYGGETWSFDFPGYAGRGRLLSKTDRNGNAMTVTYQFAAGSIGPGGNVRRYWMIANVTDAYGKSARVVYRSTRLGTTSDWVISDIAVPNGTSIHYTYDDSVNYLSRVQFPDGTSSAFTQRIDPATQCRVIGIFDAASDATHRRKDVYLSLSTWVDPGNNTVHPVAPDRVRMVVSGSGETIYANWNDNIVSGTSVIGSYVFVLEGGHRLYRYENANGAPRGVEFATDWDLNSAPSTWTWERMYAASADEQKRLTGTVDALGRATTHTYDTVASLVNSTTYPDGTASQVTWNAFRQPVRTIDRLGRRTESTYDSRGNRLTHTVAAGTPDAGTTTQSFNRRGQILTRTDANRNTTIFRYNASGFLESVSEPKDQPQDPSQAVWRFTYDSAGCRTSVVDPVGRTTRFTYDARNRCTTITYPDDSTEVTSYGAGGEANLVVARTDRNGNRTEHAYDPAGREISRTEAANSPSIAVGSTIAYLDGTSLPRQAVARGEGREYTYDHRNRLITETLHPRNGVALTTSRFYDAADQEILSTDAHGRVTARVFDVNGRVIRIVRELVPGILPPNPTSEYLLALARAMGANPDFVIEDTVYDAEGQVLKRIDGRAVGSTFTYDARGRLVEQVAADTQGSETLGSPVAARTTYTYDRVGNRTSTTFPRTWTRAEGTRTWAPSGAGTFRTTATYGGRNLMMTQTEAAGADDKGAARPELATTRWTYTLTRKIQSVTDPRGNVSPTPGTRFTTTYSYGQCCDRLESITDPAGYVTRFTYDAHGNRLTVTDGNQLTSVTTFDARHRVKSVSNAANEVTTYEYDDNLSDGIGLDHAHSPLLPFLGGLGIGPASDFAGVKVTNPAGETSYAVQDGMERTVVRVDALLHGSRIAYDARVSGLVETSTIDPLNHITRVRADAAGRVRFALDALGKVTSQGFDPNGNRVSVLDPNQVGMTCVHDARNRQTSCTDTRSDVPTTRETAYDSDSNVLSQTDALGNVTRHTFDARGRRTQSLDRIGGITRFTYDLVSNVVKIEDADAIEARTGESTDYEYDCRNLLVTERFPTGQAGRTQRTYDYDGSRRMTRRTITTTPASGFHEETTYAYDAANRLVERGYPADGLNDTFSYDPVSRLLTAKSARYLINVSRAYDAGSRLAREDQEFVAGTIAGAPVTPATYTVSYGYDADNRTTSIIYPTGDVVTRAYTDRNELAEVRMNGELVARRAYDDGGRLISTHYGNDLTETRTYVPQSDLVATIRVPGVTGFGYDYDANRRKLAETNEVVAGETQHFAYDDADRLIAWSKPAGGARPEETQTWDLTKVGDWRQTVRNGVPEPRAHNAVHELTGLGLAQLRYDAKGNLTQDDKGQVYAWDPENRLARAEVPAPAAGTAQPTVATYQYDALGRRLAKTVGRTTTRHLQSRDQVIAKAILNASADSGTTTILDSPTRTPPMTYVYGDYIDEILYLATPSERSFVHSGHLYSSAATTDSNAIILERFGYAPFGRVSTLGASSPPGGLSALSLDRAFVGYISDLETGLSCARRRQYSPDLGTFISRDRMDYKDGYSLYLAYFVPNEIDPFGSERQSRELLLKAEEVEAFQHQFKVKLLWDEKTDPCPDGTPDARHFSVEVIDLPLYLRSLEVGSSIPSVSWGPLSIGSSGKIDVTATEDFPTRSDLPCSINTDTGKRHRATFKVTVKAVFTGEVSISVAGKRQLGGNGEVGGGLGVGIHKDIILRSQTEEVVVDGPCCCPRIDALNDAMGRLF